MFSMKSYTAALCLTTSVLSLSTFSTLSTSAAHWTAGFQSGKPTLKSISQLAFGPDDILFLADTRAAAIVAIDTGDNHRAADGKTLRIEGLTQKIAALLGTRPEEILIDDLAVNPLSHQAYLAVSRGRGPTAVPALIRVTADSQLELVNLETLKFSRAELPDAPIDGVVGDAKRQSNPRMESITDIAFLEDRVLVAGLSNEEFASTLRAIPFPFKTIANGTSVEIYHGAHGRFETRSPIRTFVPFNVGNKPQLLAAYTCTPLVQFPLSDLKPGAKIKGKTVAELGNRNRPIDMIVYEKDGKEFLLIANNSRGVMKVNTDRIETVDGISQPVPDGATKGLTYETVAGWKGVDQLERLDARNAVVIRRSDSGPVNLESLPLP